MDEEPKETAEQTHKRLLWRQIANYCHLLQLQHPTDLDAVALSLADYADKYSVRWVAADPWWRPEPRVRVPIQAEIEDEDGS